MFEFPRYETRCVTASVLQVRKPIYDSSVRRVEEL